MPSSSSLTWSARSAARSRRSPGSRPTWKSSSGASPRGLPGFAWISFHSGVRTARSTFPSWSSSAKTTRLRSGRSSASRARSTPWSVGGGAAAELSAAEQEALRLLGYVEEEPAKPRPEATP